MPVTEETIRQLAAIRNLIVSQNVSMNRYTRFNIGGPASILAQTGDEEAFIAAIEVARASGMGVFVIGEGTNLIVSDQGFDGIVLRFTGSRIEAAANTVKVAAGALLQELVDFGIERGLTGLETLAGIPGSVGAAIYGNAGAYGRSISDSVRSVRFHDWQKVRELNAQQCGFQYRESVFKSNRNWSIIAAELVLEKANAAELRARADEIIEIRNKKYPPEMLCAGSIFKNLILKELPPVVADRVPMTVVREGKAPAAYFLEQVGAKGMGCGDIHVADYHANLIYNAGAGTAKQVCELIADLKSRVRESFGFDLVEEVQYIP